MHTFRGSARRRDTHKSKLQTCQNVSSTVVKAKLTGHFNDIFCGPAIMSSSSVMACNTEEAGQQQSIEKHILKNLTFLLDLLSTLEVISSEFLD